MSDSKRPDAEVASQQERGQPPMPTRRALALAVVAGGCAVAASAAIPALAFVAAPLRSGAATARWVKTVALARLREGEPERVAIVDDRYDAWTVERKVELGSIWLVRRGDKVTALSAVCPHLGCSVNVAAGQGFACPCHTSAFDPDGKRKSGPAPRDLDVLATRVEDGVIAVDFRRFRIGVPEKVETT